MYIKTVPDKLEVRITLLLTRPYTFSCLNIILNRDEKALISTRYLSLYHLLNNQAL